MPKLVVIFRKQSFKIEYLTTSCKITTPIFFSIDKCFLVVFVCVLRFMEIITGKQTMAFDFVFFCQKSCLKNGFFLNKIHHNNCVTFVLKLKSSVGSSMLVEGKLPEKKIKIYFGKKNLQNKTMEKKF